MCRARSGGDGFEGMIAICLARGGPAPASALGDPGLQGRAPSRMRRGTGAGMRESHVHDVSITKEAPNYRVDDR